MSVPATYFDELYRASDDPWHLASRWYERRKYATTLAALRRPRYRAAFEPGCSVGVLTVGLARRCDRVLAVDANPKAVDLARLRVAPYPNVAVRRRRLPDWPDDSFDLVVLSEIAYYFTVDELDLLMHRCLSTLDPGGDLVCVHWRRPVPEHIVSGDDAHKIIASRSGIEPVLHHEEDDFLLDVFARTPPGPRSVAEVEGLC